MPLTGWDTVTVPGQVAGWKALSRRYGRLAFPALFQPAIDYAENGFPVSPQIARQWAAQAPSLKKEPGFENAFLKNGRSPEAGEVWRFPEQAETLREIAESGGDSFYHGALAEKIVGFARATGGRLDIDDLASHEAKWVMPLDQTFRGYTLHEMPPSGQGIAALMALGILDHFDLESMGCDSAAFYHVCIEAMKLAFADLHQHIADTRAMKYHPADLLDPDYLASRAALIDPARAGMPPAGMPCRGGTVYLAAADQHGSMVSFIQSNYRGFGSGIVVPGTGISLHNRGLGFVLEPGHVNAVGPRKKPLHTIIPGFLTRNGTPVLAFGVMGGSMQAQGHVQVVTRLAAFGQNPQAISDAPRFRVEAGPLVHLEAHSPPSLPGQLQAMGHRVELASPDSLDFGSAQLIHRLANGGYVAASDSRRDGLAIGF
jgi:gamma-glutamyltranspeptidase/glutathione hydrolase